MQRVCLERTARQTVQSNQCVVLITGNLLYKFTVGQFLFESQSWHECVAIDAHFKSSHLCTCA